MLPKPTFASPEVPPSPTLAVPLVGSHDSTGDDERVSWPSEDEWRSPGTTANLGDDGDDGSLSDNKKLLAGGTVLAVAMFAANGGNYLLNVVLGRWLTPPEFADANLMVTLMLLVTAVAVSLQLIAARFAGIHAVSGTAEQTRAMARSLERWAAIGGIGFAALLAGGAPMWAEIFNVESMWPFVILGAGMPAYLVQAVGRGVLQGQLEFRKLAGTFVQEMLVRVVLGIALVWAGFGVLGATAALTASFIATWLAVKLALGWKPTRGEPREKISKEVLAYAGPVGILLLGQIIINNGDVLISKEGLEETQAGVYAAVGGARRKAPILFWRDVFTLCRFSVDCCAPARLKARLIELCVLWKSASRSPSHSVSLSIRKRILSSRDVCARRGTRYGTGWTRSTHLKIAVFWRERLRRSSLLMKPARALFCA